jgi:phospholipid/cholesterol/gamma-HCH transport system permease protein
MPREPIRLPLRDRLSESGWRSLRREALAHPADAPIVLDLTDVGSIETIAAARLLRLVADARAAGRDVQIAHATPAVRIALADIPESILQPPAVVPRRHPVEALGAATLDLLAHARDVIALLGEIIAGLLRPFGRRGIKWDIAIRQMAQVGARATFIVVFISFLVGVVLALNGALQLRQFGAQIFIANLVAISMTREMGPLITAILVAGRTGSAIAAELGTMVVSEEVDALRTMALSPARFLVVPKLVALAVTMPLLTVLSTTAGILGGLAIGVASLGLPMQGYLTQTVKSLWVSDLLTGLIKSVAFATIIAVVGAYRGLSVEGGPDGVGRATTSAVVTAIIICIVTNAGFTAFFYWVD